MRETGVVKIREANTGFQRFRPQTIVLALIMAVPGQVAAQAVDTNQLAQQAVAHGRASLADGNFEEAITSFQQGYEYSVELADEPLQTEVLFFLGLTNQAAEGKIGNGASDSWIREAAGYYEKHLELAPDSGPALNNLARLYERQGRPREAAKLYLRASRLGDEREFVYLSNYAKLLDGMGDSKGALEAYRTVARLKPQSSDAHATVVRRLFEAPPDELASYLWEILDEGQSGRALDASVDALALPEFQSLAPEFLAIVAVALSKQFYDPGAFFEQPAALKLRRAAEHQALREPIRGLFQVHETPGRPEDYRWWARRHDPYSESPRGVWPGEAFVELVRSIGSRYLNRRNPDRALAEAYYWLAATAREADPDPRALRDLTHLYLEGGSIDSVRIVAERFERDLFNEKGIAYATSQREKIYEYHVTLGEIYSALEQWGSRGDFKSAIFQLEQALFVAEDLENSAKSPRGSARFGPELANLLADAYLVTGDTARSTAVRVSSGERYLRDGDSTAVRKVLAPATSHEVNKATPRDRGRFEVLQKAVGTTSVNRFDRVDPAARPQSEALDKAKVAETVEQPRIEQIQEVVDPAAAKRKQ